MRFVDLSYQSKKIRQSSDYTPDDIPLIAVSNGSACTSATIDPSHVLTAMGLDETSAFNCIRFSLGKFNSKKELSIVIETVKNITIGLKALSI